MKFLEKMRMVKEAEISAAKKQLPLAKIKKNIKKASHSFAKALRRKNGIALIAEFKKSSPSAGSINSKAGLEKFAKLFGKYADAISILTEKKFFSGKTDFTRTAKRFTSKPVLRKDFIIDAYQVYEARYYRADAVLLIANMLPEKKLRELTALTESLGMDALVECDDASSLRKALASGSELIGINNRNLNTMEEDFSKTRRLAKIIPASKRKKMILVSESSISTRKQVESLKGVADAVLVGTSIMNAPVPEVKLKELTGKTLIKFCGTTSKKDALGAVKLGADLIGLNFYKKSPRFVTAAGARKIADAVRGKVLVAGVFVNMEKSGVKKIAKAVGLNVLQFSGNETPAYVKSFKSFGLPVIKAIHVRDAHSVSRAAKYDADFVMLDSFSEGLYGGTGKRIDFGLMGKNKKIKGKKVVFSGGLNAENVGRVIRQFSPLMVDVCSGIEAKPGRKSFSKMKSFISSVKGAGK